MPTVAKKVLRSEILKHYEEKLPENYRAVKTVDTKNQFTVKVFGFLRFVLFAVVFALALFAFGTDFRQMSEEFYALSDVRKFLTIFLFMVCFALYMLLHEFLHALVYKIFTKHGGRSEVSFQRGADNNAHLKNMVKIVFLFLFLSWSSGHFCVSHGVVVRFACALCYFQHRLYRSDVFPAKHRVVFVARRTFCHAFWRLRGGPLHYCFVCFQIP